MTFRSSEGLERELRESWALQCFREGICPECGKTLVGADKYGSGQVRDGICCSLECFSHYYYGRGSTKPA